MSGSVCNLPKVIQHIQTYIDSDDSFSHEARKDLLLARGQFKENYENNICRAKYSRLVGVTALIAGGVSIYKRNSSDSLSGKDQLLSLGMLCVCLLSTYVWFRIKDQATKLIKTALNLCNQTLSLDPHKESINKKTKLDKSTELIEWLDQGADIYQETLHNQSVKCSVLQRFVDKGYAPVVVYLTMLESDDEKKIKMLSEALPYVQENDVKMTEILIKLGAQPSKALDPIQLFHDFFKGPDYHIFKLLYSALMKAKDAESEQLKPRIRQILQDEIEKQFHLDNIEVVIKLMKIEQTKSEQIIMLTAILSHLDYNDVKKIEKLIDLGAKPANLPNFRDFIDSYYAKNNYDMFKLFYRLALGNKDLKIENYLENLLKRILISSKSFSADVELFIQNLSSLLDAMGAQHYEYFMPDEYLMPEQPSNPITPIKIGSFDKPSAQQTPRLEDLNLTKPPPLPLSPGKESASVSVVFDGTLTPPLISLPASPKRPAFDSSPIDVEENLLPNSGAAIRNFLKDRITLSSKAADIIYKMCVWSNNYKRRIWQSDKPQKQLDMDDIISDLQILAKN